MRKIILDLAVTLDGFIEGPNGEIDWCIMDSEGEGDFTEFLDDIDTIFYGRVSYDLWGNYQPGESDSPVIKNLYQSIHSKTKYVFTSSATAGDGKAVFISSDTTDRVNEIRDQPGKDIWLYGGAKLITTFINLGLVDIYRLAVHPVILGAGKPLFNDIQDPVGLKLIEAKGSASGVVLLSYASSQIERA
ncbi:dihydrofolate reductase [Flavihumibacter sp. R14]|nr:dihydrofolate reductase [Flavihumibacter soli]